MIKSSDYVACICEGNSEKYIMQILLENNSLNFNKNQLLDERILVNTYRSPKIFTDQFLNLDYGDDKIVILLIVDSKNMKFKLDKLYTDTIRNKFFVITAPELEMLIIHASNLYEDYVKVKSKLKPSQFLSSTWGIKTSKIKSKEFINDFFQSHSLTDAIQTHKSKSIKNTNANQIFLADLLK